MHKSVHRSMTFYYLHIAHIVIANTFLITHILNASIGWFPIIFAELPCRTSSQPVQLMLQVHDNCELVASYVAMGAD